MLDVVVNIDQGCSKCLVYKTRESTLSGQLKIKTSDRLKLRQLAIRLISTELVDISDDVNKGSSSSSAASATGGDSLHPYLQKTSIAICTWAVLPKNGTTHVLEPGNHQYAIDMPLPKGLDGSIETKAYALRYELATRLEYSFILKPDTVVTTPLELDQVPMARDLYSDDRISLTMPVRQYIPESDEETLRPEDIPLGQALCLKKDTISQRNPFVFAHLWDNCLSLRLRFPRGRAFSVASQPLISFEALPISKEYKVTNVVAYIEEIAIIARPQKAESSSSGRQKSNSISFSPGSSATNPYGGTAPQDLLETTTAVVSPLTTSAITHTATSSQDSLEPNPLHNALAYAREWSSEYANAITKVRELGRDTQSSRFGPIELPKSHGMLSGRLHLRMPDSASSKAAHPDMRNSHVQVHHQLVYIVQYHRVKALAGDNDIVEGSSTVESMNTQRIKAAARLYGKLGQSNIVRREELKPNAPPLATPLTHEYWSKPRTVRGTLPISVVSGKIGELWGIRDITEDYDTSDFGQEPEASVDMPLPALHHVPDRPTVSSDSNSSMTMPMPLLSHSRKGQQSMNISSEVTQFDDTHSPLLNSIQPPMPGSGFAPNVGGMYPPNPQPPQISAAPMGFNPMLLSSQSPYPPFPAYPPSTIGFGPMDPSMRASFVPPPMPGSPSHPPPQQHQQHPYGGVSEAAPYSNPIFQQQIIQFQEQQRQQQQQFFEQLSRQYSQMAVPHQEAFYSATMSNVPQLGSLYPPHLPPTLTPNITTAASVSQQSSAGMEHPTLELADTPTQPVSAEQGEQPASSALNRQNTVASEDIMLATVDRLEQMSLSQQTSSPADANVAETQAGEQQQQQQQPEHDPPIAPPRTASTQSDTATHGEPQPDESAHVDVQSPDNASTRQPDATGRSSPPPNYEDLLPPDYEVPTTQPPPYNAAERSRRRRLHEY